MKEIPLSQGRVAVVDDDDYPQLVVRNWYFHKPTGYALGYVTTGRGRSPVYMHRVILGAKRGDYVDHANKDKLDNRKSNIRMCSQTENLLNGHMCGYSGRKTSSQYRGVSAIRNRWRAAICNKTIGYFDTEIEAAHAYDVAASAMAPAFANLNFGEST